jgi:hypothetical protein
MYNEAQIFRQFLAVMAKRDLALSPRRQFVANGEWQRCSATNKPRSK